MDLQLKIAEIIKENIDDVGQAAEEIIEMLQGEGLLNESEEEVDGDDYDY